MELKDLTEKIIGCAFKVHNKLGFGFLESVYEKALNIELTKSKLNFNPQKPLRVLYDGEIVGEFIPDILVEDKIIIELKAVQHLSQKHEVQLVNYLVASGKPIGLLINFGENGVEVKRKYKDPKKS